MSGNRKVEMLQHTQKLVLGYSLVFLFVKMVAPSVPIEVMSYGLIAIAGNFASFATANVMGDHRGKKDAPASSPQ
jgi:hypothetical protein